MCGRYLKRGCISSIEVLSGKCLWCWHSSHTPCCKKNNSFQPVFPNRWQKQGRVSEWVPSSKPHQLPSILPPKQLHSDLFPINSSALQTSRLEPVHLHVTTSYFMMFHPDLADQMNVLNKLKNLIAVYNLMMLPPVDSMGNSVGSKGRTIFFKWPRMFKCQASHSRPSRVGADQANWRFPKIEVPQIIHFHRNFHCKPSILGSQHFVGAPTCHGFVWCIFRDLFQPLGFFAQRSTRHTHAAWAAQQFTEYLQALGVKLSHYLGSEKASGRGQEGRPCNK
jgi:hypothetical protein